METKAKGFFLLLMSVFILGVLIHFVIPLQFVVNGTQRIQEVYNGYKMEIQQNTVRGLAYLNSKIIANQIQIYQNVRSTVIRLFENGNTYDTIKSEKIHLNSAYQLANMNQTQLVNANLNTSMWYISNVVSLVNLNPTQQWVMNQYCQIQAYLEGMQILSQFYLGLISIQIYINIGQEFYFEFPSSINQNWKSPNASVLNKYFQKTIINYLTQKRIQTIFSENESIKACSPILDGETPFAVVCLNLNSRIVTEKITSTLKVPNFETSSTNYYLVKPLYAFQNSNRPLIISNFTSNNLSDIHVPQSEQYFEQLDPQTTRQLFTPGKNYELNVMQIQRTKTYYVIPVETYNNLDSKQTCLYLVVVNTFSQAQLKSQSRYKQFFVVMIVPSCLFLIISSLAMGFIMRPLFAKLQQSSVLMNDYCHYIRKNDMNLEIAEVGETSDIIQIFTELKYFNLLNKFSTPSYLQVSDNQRIIRLLRGLELFDELGYTKVNIYQNLSQCYMRTGEYANAQRYLKMSVDSTIYELGGVEGINKMILKYYGKKNSNKKQYNQLKNICYKLYKLCIIIHKTCKPGDINSAEELSRSVNFLRKFNHKNHISTQYVLCFLLQCISNLESQIQKQILFERLQLGSELIKCVQFSNKSNNNIPLQILKSYFYYFKGRLLVREKQFFQGYQSFILALDGKKFDPDIHRSIKEQIQKIMLKYDIGTIDTQQIFSYLKQQKSRSMKEYIFLFDASNPKMTAEKFSKWKSKAKKVIQYIFDKYITSKDRVGISEFCQDLKVVNNLIQKGTSSNILKKQLLGSLKARDQAIYSQLTPNLCKTIERTKHLKKEKIYIIVLKQGQAVSSQEISNQIELAQNSTFIFVVEEGSRRIKGELQGFYVVGLESYADIDVILGEKSIKRADNIIYLF